jgi:hypothetical protein
MFFLKDELSSKLYVVEHTFCTTVRKFNKSYRNLGKARTRQRGMEIVSRTRRVVA